MNNNWAPKKMEYSQKNWILGVQEKKCSISKLGCFQLIPPEIYNY